MFYEVIPAKLIGRSHVDVLTYASEENLQPGHLVLIPLRNSKIPGIIVKKVEKPAFKVKPIEKLLYTEPLPAHLLKSLLWLSNYYLNPLPSVAAAILPNGLEKNRRQPKTADELKPALFSSSANLDSSSEEESQIPLNPAQKQALARIENTKTATKLLFGITGSGKTNIYLKLAENALKARRSVILLVPEIALTSQLVQVFEQTFKNRVTLLHSRQTDSTRHQIWEKILSSNQPEIIIGPRSALFAPVKNLGLIIIDEAHESSYYQENTPRYSTTRLASFLAGTLKISCVLGTATPLLSDYYLAKKHNALVELKTKAKKTVSPAKVNIIDLKDRSLFSQNRYFSTPLLNAIRQNLENHHQTLIFHNRRGSAPLTICEHCGYEALCPTCFLPLNLHLDSYQLVCHSCGRTENVPLNCPDCHSENIVHKGFGTKLLESELRRLFPTAKIARFDADNKKGETLDSLYESVKNGDFDIIIGTQTVAKGLDLPLLATVGIAQADAGLNLPDFAAEEHTFELINQVIGRVGRGHLTTANVFIQTYQPDHPAITYAATSDYESFSAHLLKNRKTAKLPPFSYLAKISITYKTEKTVLKYIKLCQKDLLKNSGIIVSAPTPAFHERSLSGYTWQLILKSTSRKNLKDALKSLPKSGNLKITLDPPSLLTA